MNLPQQKRLTEVEIKKIKLPEVTPIELSDGLVPGLALRVTSLGTKTWCFLYRFNKKNRRMTLGRYPEITLKEARELARTASKAINSEGVKIITTTNSV